MSDPVFLVLLLIASLAMLPVMAGGGGGNLVGTGKYEPDLGKVKMHKSGFLVPKDEDG